MFDYTLNEQDCITFITRYEILDNKIAIYYANTKEAVLIPYSQSAIKNIENKMKEQASMMDTKEKQAKSELFVLTNGIGSSIPLGSEGLGLFAAGILVLFGAASYRLWQISPVLGCLPIGLPIVTITTISIIKKRKKNKRIKELQSLLEDIAKTRFFLEEEKQLSLAKEKANNHPKRVLRDIRENDHETIKNQGVNISSIDSMSLETLYVLKKNLLQEGLIEQLERCEELEGELIVPRP